MAELAKPAELASPGEPPRGEISPRITSKVRVVHNLRAPMRDGVELSVDLVRPDVEGRFPVILMRTPYDKTVARANSEGQFRNLAERGYIVAVNDCRGRFNSDGRFFPYMNEADDGYDTVEWIAAQDWCDGNVGMIGGSYVGQTQWYAACRVPPHLKAIAPTVSPPASLWRNEPIFNGTMLVQFSEWMVGMGQKSWQVGDFSNTIFKGQQDYFEALPLDSLPAAAGFECSWWHEMLKHPTYDDFWKRGSYDNYAEMNVPALNMTGWWDMNFPGAPLNFEAMRAHAKGDGRIGQKLVIGGWPHWVNRTRKLSDWDFGEHAVIELDSYIIRFFDRWLKGRRNNIENEKPVYVFVIGANEWWAEDDWPLTGTEYVDYHFHSGGNANTLNGSGTLSREKPAAGEQPDRYQFDPANCSRVFWNLHEGPIDDRIVTTRPDVLCYTSEPLTEPLDVVGWVTCHLFASSSAKDTDWHVRLVDVHPDGSARFLCRGAMRARFRESLEKPKLLEPGEPVKFEFTMDAIGVRFLPGHRIRVEVMSSWFTEYDRNMNTGSENPFHDDKAVVANQTVYHEPGLESRVILPVVQGRGK